MVAELSTDLDSILDCLPDEMVRSHVPGLQVAVVRENAVLYTGGVGIRDVSSAAPVTSATLFQHGSCGKAYTSLLASVLAVDGVLDLDVPVRRYVPELQLVDPVLTERVTTRDLLSHRSGLGRHDPAWICNPTWNRQECVRRLAYLPLAATWRSGMNYSNFGYALAGLVIDRATGSTWEAEMRARILEPAGMTRTGVSFQALENEPDVAAPHLVQDGVATPTSHRSLNGVAPAGLVLTCATDAARWLQLHLGKGKIGETAVLPEAAVVAAHHPQIVLPPGMRPMPEMWLFGYALGWVVGTYRGRPYISHNGGVVGFHTETVLFPEDGIGVTVSANSHTSNLTLAAALQIADALLGAAEGQSWFDRLRGEDVAPKPTPHQNEPVHEPSHALSEYAATYSHDGYGDLIVESRNDGLRVFLGSEELACRHRHYDTWDLRYEDLDFKVTLTFYTDPEGVVSEAILPLEAGSAPIRFGRRPAAAEA